MKPGAQSPAARKRDGGPVGREGKARPPGQGGEQGLAHCRSAEARVNLSPVGPSAPAVVMLSVPAPRLSGGHLPFLCALSRHCFLSTTSKRKLLLFFSVRGKERERTCSLLSAVRLSPSVIKPLRLQGWRYSPVMEGRSFHNLGGVKMATALGSTFGDQGHLFLTPRLWGHRDRRYGVSSLDLKRLCGLCPRAGSPLPPGPR